MAQINQFGSSAPGQSGSTRDCLRYEAMLADVVDGTLSVEEQAAFDQHAATCDSCSEMLKDAKRGAAWLAMLKPFPPAPPALLVDRILAETSVRSAREAVAARAAERAATEAASLLGRSPETNPRETALSTSIDPAISPEPGRVLPFRSRLPAPVRPLVNMVFQTRFVMTAAMAFFSVALTLNLTGVRISDLHARDLRPSSLRRSFYEANAHVVRYYENLRVVYELESRVRELQHSNDAEPPSSSPARPPADEAKPDKKPDAPGTPQASPVGKPHSGLSNGSESRGSGDPAPAFDRRDDAGLPHRHLRFVPPSGAVLPVSFSFATPSWQKRGVV